LGRTPTGSARRVLGRLVPFLRRGSDRIRDARDVVLGRRDALTPPRHLLRISTDPAADFRDTGRTLVRFLASECGLTPDCAVLDVGCGVGRLAVALTGYLGDQGRYEGFDVVPEEIAWCARHISPRFPRFAFHVADVRSQTYHPDGAVPASAYRFPFDDDQFDVVVVASVFTHLLTADMTRYVAEVARVMAPGGRCLASYYLMNERARAGIRTGTSVFTFANDVQACHVERADRPDVAVAHDETPVRDLYARRGLVIDRIFFGKWPVAPVQDQDLVVARRPKAP
jgi:SAM-dependent methyltransferase